MENEGLYLTAKAALEFIQSIDGYENCVCAVNLRRELQAVEHSVQADVAYPCDCFVNYGVGENGLCKMCGGKPRR